LPLFAGKSSTKVRNPNERDAFGFFSGSRGRNNSRNFTGARLRQLRAVIPLRKFFGTNYLKALPFIESGRL
jgi:hypothetical protein